MYVLINTLILGVNLNKITNLFNNWQIHQIDRLDHTNTSKITLKCQKKKIVTYAKYKTRKK